MTHERIRDKVMQELKQSFRPEFLNRIDEIVVFRELSRQNVKDIVDMMMKRVHTQLESQDVTLELTDGAKDVLAQEGYDASLGARPLRRAIQRLLEDPLSEKILWKEFTAGQQILADAEVDEDHPKKKSKIVFKQGTGKRKAKAPTAPETPPVELAGSPEN
jgi:ATP-dependent Clp protease ATP-binding subunit ClpC